MNRFLLLLAIAGITFLIILFASRPDLWDKFILWIVGLLGLIIRILRIVWTYFKRLFARAFPQQARLEQPHREFDLRTDESVG